MQLIESRQDIRLLVNNFYEKIRSDALLGPIFNDRIAESAWPAHLTRLTDFWETNLLAARRFRGDPSAKHLAVDRHMGFSLSEDHFEHWLTLWAATVDGLFKGDRAEQAKTSARRIATAQFTVILRNRPS